MKARTQRFIAKDRNSHSQEREDCFGVYDDQEKLKTPAFSLH
jgi:hypothetical protein